jgi:hypothetical protein
MKIAAIRPPGGHFLPLMDQLANGMRIAGDEVVETLARHQYLDVDAVVCWGWRTGKRVRQFNPRVPVLVMERGYVGDRFHWTSLGWNGLNGRARFQPRGNYARWMEHFTLEPWREIADHRANARLNSYALILGQVQSDQACVNVNLAYQYRAWYSKLTQDGWKVRFRPHPKALRQGSGLPSGIYLQGSLEQDLAGAAFTVSWNSNSSVDSVLAGVPSVTLDEGAMAWPVTSHDLSNPVTMPSRTEWAAQLAWCQWQPAELSDGTAWKAVREVMP